MVIALVLFILINRRAPSGLLRPFINLVQQLTVMLARRQRALFAQFGSPLPRVVGAAAALSHWPLGS